MSRRSQNLYDNLILHDKREAVPDGFVHVGRLPLEKTIDLQIGLHGQDIPGLVQCLYATSTPGNPKYRKFLSKEQAGFFARPTEEALRQVQAWLGYHQVQFVHISPSGNRIQITVPVSKANAMFQATFSAFRHAETGTESYQALSYSLPSEVKQMIQSVEPTTSFPNPVPRPSLADNPNLDIEQVVVTPTLLSTMYGIPTTKATQTGTLLSVAGFKKQYANREDLKSFLSIFRPDFMHASFTDNSINGGQNIQIRSEAGGEANLDIQYTVGLVNGSPVEFLSSGQEKTGINAWIAIANYWLSLDNPPTVVSISYSFDERNVSKDSAKTLSDLYAQLGARGVSILVSSGDGGVGGSRDRGSDKFVPTFPSTSPYVTSVGATRSYPEVAAPFSSGGFSNYFERDEAPYQEDAVDGYLDQIGTLYEGRFNRDGRAFPDISAQGQNAVVMKDAVYHRFYGTSVSTPICASIITLLNDRLIGQKGSPLGFLNPLLYANPAALNDIIEGNNPGSHTLGFPAARGWDPVTGLGTPDFAKIENVIMAPSVSNGSKTQGLWVKHPDGTINQIVYGSSIMPHNMVPGTYRISTEETVLPPVFHEPAPRDVIVTNVGQEDLSFWCPNNDGASFVLSSAQSRVLERYDYLVNFSLRLPPNVMNK